VCLGAVVTLTAAATGAIEYSFNGPNNWQAGNTAVVTVNQYNPSYTVVARTALGCTSSASTTVAVEAAPVNVLLEASNTLVCSGTAVTLTVTPTDADAYSFDNGTTWQSGNTTSVTVTGNVTYTAKARSPLGCESSAVQESITVQAAPTVSLSASSATVCGGTLVTLTATAGASSYSFNNGVWQTGNTTNVTVDNTTTYTVKARSPLGCETATAASATVAVQAAPTITLSASSATVCAGTVVTLTATAGASSYSFNNGVWQTGNTTNVTVDANTTYTVKARSPLGCETASAASATVAVQAAPTVSLSAASTTVCAGTSVQLTATAGAASYQFNNGSWQTGNTTNVTVNSTTTYTVKARSPLGCETAAAASATVVGEAAPSLTSLTVSAASVCTGAAATLTATVSGATSYSFDDGTTWQTENTLQVTPTTTTTYTLRAKNALGCISSDSKTVTLTVSVPPTATITSAPSTACPGSGFLVYASGGSSYCFSTSGTCNPTATTSYSYQSMPNYSITVYVTVRNAAGCTASTSKTITPGNASTCGYYSSACGFSINLSEFGPGSWNNGNGSCPSGWRLPTGTELGCIYTNLSSLLTSGHAYWSSTDSGNGIGSDRALCAYLSCSYTYCHTGWSQCTTWNIPANHCWDFPKDETTPHSICVK
jgi:hypothetical protein